MVYAYDRCETSWSVRMIDSNKKSTPPVTGRQKTGLLRRSFPLLWFCAGGLTFYVLQHAVFDKNPSSSPLERAMKTRLPDQTTEKVIEKLEREQRYEEAADLAENNGQTSKATELYQKALDDYSLLKYTGNALRVQGKLAERAGHKEQANQLYEQAIKAFLEQQRLVPAAELAEKLGDLQQAMTLYAKGGFYYSAAELAERLGDTDRARIYRVLDKAQEKR